MGMTNREKFKEIYGFDVDCGHCNPYPCLENDCEWWEQCENEPGCPCDGWWEMEYKEPTIKNNLSSGTRKKLEKNVGELDCISREAAINAIDMMSNTATVLNLQELPSFTPKMEPRWITVSEKLPEDDKDVLIFTIAKSIYKACHSLKEWTDDQYEWFVMGTIGWSLTYEDDEVLAWMPLPEPYKAAGEET